MTQDQLVAQVAALTTRAATARSALEEARLELGAASLALSQGWTALRDFQDELVRTALPPAPD